MKRSAAFFLFSFLALTLEAAVVDVAPQYGRALPSISWIDETGQSRQLNEFTGYPLVLLPIYTRCRGACVQNVDQLKKTLATSSADPRQFRVLLFSFDERDHPASLTKYREREAIPLSWSIGSASQGNIDTLLEAIGIQVGKAGTEFTHPNIVVFIDSKLRIAQWIYGTSYSAREVDRALNSASGRGDWIGQHGDVLYAVLLWAASILCVLLACYLKQLNQLRRLSGVRNEHRSSIASV